ncbi:hypothetical protein AT278_16290 [Bacillus cereus]|uniref:hypothetical protein n=1 Tax=Bacillus TaxID=1386 RepID=UPI00077A75B2|nr:hypothetical protein [Bacillus cereus]KXY56173.1 hypothetical protein AT278_16290 [Bacillus cereus]
MFKKLAIGTFAISIIFSGVTSVSAAKINDTPLKVSDDNPCKNVTHKFSELFNSKPPKNYTKNGIKGERVCTYKSSVSYIGYYN